MKLIHPDLYRQIFAEDKGCCEFVIESQELFAKYVNELNSQISGNEGKFVLSDCGKEISMSKFADIIINPISVDINDRKILMKLYEELKGIAQGEEYYIRTQEVLKILHNYFVNLEQSSDYILGIDDEIDISSIFKLLGVKFEIYAEDLLDKIIQYLKIAAGLLKKKLVVFVNIRSYINSNQLEELIKTSVYEEINLLFIENVQRKSSKLTDLIIIDSFGCEIC